MLEEYHNNRAAYLECDLEALRISTDTFLRDEEDAMNIAIAPAAEPIFIPNSVDVSRDFSSPTKSIWGPMAANVGSAPVSAIRLLMN